MTKNGCKNNKKSTSEDLKQRGCTFSWILLPCLTRLFRGLQPPGWRQRVGVWRRWRWTEWCHRNDPNTGSAFSCGDARWGLLLWLRQDKYHTHTHTLDGDFSSLSEVLIASTSSTCYQIQLWWERGKKRREAECEAEVWEIDSIDFDLLLWGRAGVRCSCVNTVE